MGCTEPIALSFVAAKARELLGEIPDQVDIGVSGNILKNVKSVIVPHTGGLRGIKVAAAIGIIAGDASKKLEVISDATPEEIKKMQTYIEKTDIKVSHVDTPYIFDIQVKVVKGSHNAFARVINNHTNIVRLEKDGKILFTKECSSTSQKCDRKSLTISNILKFVRCCKIEDVKEILDRQIKYNMAIAEEGMKNNYGANIGKTLLKVYGGDVKIKARAYAAAGSDARMNGCEMPVVINSGSGNQGITASVPVIVFARELGKSEDSLYRSLLVSNLTTIHIKSGIGTLSAYCGAVGAGVGAGCGIAYLLGGDEEVIEHTLVNAIAITSGIICDGAKASCAGKISSSIDAGILGYYMYKEGNEFHSGDGIVKKGVENTINNVSKLAKDGMCSTDKEIIKLMIDE